MTTGSPSVKTAEVITNTDFLSELAKAAPEGTCLWVNRFKGNPNGEDASWGGMVSRVRHQIQFSRLFAPSAPIKSST
jgi:hypothetical protein